MKNFLKNIAYDFGYIFTNYFIAYIPFWSIRKLLYKAEGMKIGRGSRINMRCIVMAPYRITIGSNTLINEFCVLDGRGKLNIGNDTSVSMYAKVYTATHKSYSESFEYITKQTVIKDNCWIGASAVVMPGSVIEDFTIISVNSVFKGESKCGEIWMGIPAKKVRKRQTMDKYKLKNNIWWR
jgi:maltose O-acetyltransferase